MRGVVLLLLEAGAVSVVIGSSPKINFKSYTDDCNILAVVPLETYMYVHAA